MAYREGDVYGKRDDNPPALVEALASFGFPADFDPAQLPTGMFSVVCDTWRDVEREHKGLPPLPRKTLGDVWREQDERAAREASKVKPKEKLERSCLQSLKCSMMKIFSAVVKGKKTSSAKNAKG